MTQITTENNLSFWTKFICLLIIIPITAFISKPLILLVTCLLCIGLFIKLNVNFSIFWKQTRSYLIPITISLIILSIIFDQGDYLTRLTNGGLIAIRFALLISLGTVFSLITNPIEFVQGFLEAKIPHKFGVTLMVGYRMMPLLTQKMNSIITAQKARGASFHFSIKHINKFIYQLLSLIVPLLYATLSMSVKLSDALIARGYNPDGKISLPESKWSLSNYLLILICTILLVVSYRFN